MQRSAKAPMKSKAVKKAPKTTPQVKPARKKSTIAKPTPSFMTPITSMFGFASLSSPVTQQKRFMAKGKDKGGKNDKKSYVLMIFLINKPCTGRAWLYN